MTLKEALERQWQQKGVRNISHLSRWRAIYNEWGVEAVWGNGRGKKVLLKIKRSKYRGATQPWLTPDALQRYRAHRAYYIDQVNQARKVLGLV